MWIDLEGKNKMKTKYNTFTLNTVADIISQAKTEGVKLNPKKIDKIREQVARDLINNQGFWDEYWTIIADAITEIDKNEK